MVAFSALVAVVLYLVPVAVVVFWRTERPKTSLDVALAIPTAVALDLLILLVVARLVTFEVAVLVSRPAWIVAWLVRLWRGPRGSFFAIDRATWLAAIASAVGGFRLSMWVSRPYGIWDRAWHVPLVTSMRGQTFPFSNVFEPGKPLFYHQSGDALAALLQALSRTVLHSSFALSLAHDIMFALTGMTVALLLSFVGWRTPTRIFLGSIAVLMNGPWTAIRKEVGALDVGYSLFNYVTLSFRPHVALAGLMLTALVGGVLVRAQNPTIGARQMLPSLFACSALLAITDEASFAIFGLALGITWIAKRTTIHPRWSFGIAALGLVAVEFPVFNALFLGGIAKGGPVSELAVVAARVPGYFTAQPLPFSSFVALQVLVADVGAPLTACALLARNWRRRRAHSITALACVGTITAASLFLLMKIEVNHSPPESHRFFTLAHLAGALALTMCLPQLPRTSVSRPVALVALALSVVSTLLWIDRVAPTQADKPNEAHEQIDCRREVGARLFEKTRPTYFSSSVLWLASGCRTAFMPGVAGGWSIKVMGPMQGRGALEELHTQLPDQPVRMFCALEDADPACRFATAHDKCKPAGRRTRTCELAPAERQEVLAAW
jgi:hypothetical protein